MTRHTATGKPVGRPPKPRQYGPPRPVGRPAAFPKPKRPRGRPRIHFPSGRSVGRPRIIHNKQDVQEAHVRYTYKLKAGQKEQMWENQGRACAICGKKLVLWGRCGNCAYPDHNHGSGQVRDLLCHQCNLRVGKVENALYRGLLPDPPPLKDLYQYMTDEEMDRYQAEIDYLERWDENNSTETPD